MTTTMTRTYSLTPTETVTVRQADEDVLEVEVAYGPGGDAPPKHLHPAQDESFEVLAGTIRTRVEGEERDLGEGETIEIPRGAVHQLWNPGDEEARAIWQTRPPGRTLDWFAQLDALQREGRVGKDGMPGPLAFGVYLTEYRDVFRLAVAPDPLVRPLLAGLAVAGRLRGYRIST